MTSALLFFFISLLVNYTNCIFTNDVYIYLQLYLIYEFVYIIYRQNIWNVIELLLLSKAMHVQCLSEWEREREAAAGIWWVRQVEGRRERRRWRREAEPARFSQWKLNKAEHTTRTYCSFKISAHYCCFHFTDRALQPTPRNFVSSFHFTMHFPFNIYLSIFSLSFRLSTVSFTNHHTLLINFNLRKHLYIK